MKNAACILTRLRTVRGDDRLGSRPQGMAELCQQAHGGDDTCRENTCIGERLSGVVLMTQVRIGEFVARTGGARATSFQRCARTALTDLGWLRHVAILIPEIRGDLVGRIRIEYSGGLPHRCWMLMVAFSFAASVAPTGVSKRIRLARVGASAVGRPTRARASEETASGVRHRCALGTSQKCIRPVGPKHTHAQNDCQQDLVIRRQNDTATSQLPVTESAPGGCDLPQLAYCRLLLRGVTDARSWTWQHVPKNGPFL